MDDGKLILSAVERANDKIDNLKEDIGVHGARLASIETHIQLLIGDGETGRIPRLEREVRSVTNKMYFWSGLGTALSAALHFLFPHRG